MMKLLRAIAVAAFGCAALPFPAGAQTPPNWTYGQVPTPGQWNAAFAGKQDYLGSPPVLTTGGTLTGRLVTSAPSSTLAGLNLTPGSTPSQPANGDIWVTTAGFFAQVNGVTIGPIGGGSSASFAAASPLSVSFPSGVVTYACATCSVTTNPLSQFASTTSAQLAGIISDETGGGSLVFGTAPTITSANMVTPLLGVATATSINKVAITAPATSATLTIANGTTLALAGGSFTFNSTGSGSSLTGASGKALTFNNSLSFSGTDGTSFVFPGASDTIVTLAATQTLTNKTLTSPTLTTPNIGVAAGTSLALGGATLGSNTLAVSGATTFSGIASVLSNSANAFTVGANGVTNPVLQVNASTASQADGISITGAAAGSGTNIVAISSGANSPLSLNAKGSGTIGIGGTSTGNVTLAGGGGQVVAAGDLSLSTSVIRSAAPVSIGISGTGNAQGLLINCLLVNASYGAGCPAAGVVNVGSGYQIGGAAASGNYLRGNSTSFVSSAIQFADLPNATSAQYIAGSPNVVVPASVAYTAETTTTFGATTSFDFSTFINTAVTLTGNITTMNVSNAKPGQAGQIRFIQSGAGSFTAAWNPIFKFPGGIQPSLTTGSGTAVDVLFYSCISASVCYASLNKDMR